MFSYLLAPHAAPYHVAPLMNAPCASACTQGAGHAMLFVDNAGSDVVLGMLPLARELARQGTKVCREGHPSC